MVSKHIETELKLYCTDANVWENIMSAQALVERTVPESRATEELEAHYFDTPTYSLQKEKIAYRVRREGGNWVATVKAGGSSKGGLHARQEWNILVSDEQPDIGVFSDTEIGARLQEIVGDQVLEPILITRFERQRVDVLMSDGSKIEVAADRGEIVAGNMAEPILEVELELKSGQSESLFILGAELSREYPLLPESRSKFYRGLVLAGLMQESPKKNDSLSQLDKKGSISEVLRAVLVDLIHQLLLAQQAFLENNHQPELVHELRVCLRRLRSMVEFSEPLHLLEQYGWYQEELSGFGEKLGVLREIDVAYAGWQQLFDSQVLTMDSKLWLGEFLTDKRSEEAEKCCVQFKAGLTTPLLLSLWAELIDQEQKEQDAYGSSVEEYITNRVSLWLKTMRKQEETVEWADAEKAHNIRLWAKKSKYVIEILQPVLGDMTRLISQLDKLQISLGIVRDAHSTDLLLKNLLRGKSSRALALEAGMLIGWQGRERVLILKKLDKMWKKFSRLAKKRI
jgi:triphosphatase